jgi:cell division protease FtsH
VTQHKNVSDETAHAIDEEIRSIVDRNYERARSILTENLQKLHVMAEALIKYETIDSHQIDDIMEGRTPRPPKDWGKYEGPTAGQGKLSEDKGKRPADGTIGGPAGQH